MKTHRIPVKTRQFLTVAAVISTLGLVACGADDSAVSAEPVETTEAELVDVDPETFAVGSGHVLRYEIDGSSGECVISERGASCFATVAEDVPDIEIPPFPEMRPSAVTAGEEGVDYTMIEGVPRAEETLDVGERIRIGGSECSRLDGSTLRCSYDGVGFTVSGADREVELDEDPIGRYFVDDSDNGVGELSTLGTTCGNVSTSEFESMDGHIVIVANGEVDCEEGFEVMETYLGAPFDQSAGNTNAQAVGDWNCFIPTAARSAELALLAKCELQDGSAVGVAP